MCLTPIHSKPFIAEEDIFCNKCLIKESNCLYTPYQKASIKFNDGIYIQLADRFSFDASGDIHQGIHSYYRHSIFSRKLIVYPCIIPKGTEFYVGNNSDLVSLKLIIFKNISRYWTYKIFHK